MRGAVLTQPETRRPDAIAPKDFAYDSITLEFNAFLQSAISVVDNGGFIDRIVNQDLPVARHQDVVATEHRRVIHEDFRRVQAHQAAELVQQNQRSAVQHGDGIQVNMTGIALAVFPVPRPILSLLVYGQGRKLIALRQDRVFSCPPGSQRFTRLGKLDCSVQLRGTGPDPVRIPANLMKVRKKRVAYRVNKL